MQENLWEVVSRFASATSGERGPRLPRTRVAPWALHRFAARRRAFEAQLARLAAAVRLAGRHDE